MSLLHLIKMAAFPMWYNSGTTDTKWDCSNAAVMLGQQQSTGKSTV